MFENDNGKFSTSILDHFITLRRSRTKVLEAGVLHSVENLSDHEPIYAAVAFNSMHIQKEKVESCSVRSRPLWEKGQC